MIHRTSIGRGAHSSKGRFVRDRGGPDAPGGARRDAAGDRPPLAEEPDRVPVHERIQDDGREGPDRTMSLMSMSEDLSIVRTGDDRRTIVRHDRRRPRWYLKASK
jgi:hypothetical protein